MLKVVEGFEMRGREFARHWVDQLVLGIRIVRIHLKQNREGGGWSRVQTRRCPARHCSKIFTLLATLLPSQRNLLSSLELLMSGSLLILIVPVMKIKRQPKELMEGSS